MTKREKRVSRVERRSETSEGTASLAAAKLAWSVVELLNRTRDVAGLKNTDLAEKLGITEGRVSQVMNSDGNLHVATLGRFLRACGYELAIHPRPVETGRPELGFHHARGVHADMFTQCYLTEAGVFNEVAIVSNPDSDHVAVPFGGPKHVATSGRDQSRWKFIDSPTDDWIHTAEAAVSAEEPERIGST